MRRVLAVVGAVAMVAGALFVRGRLDDKKVEAGQGPYRLVCSADLGQVCDDLQADLAEQVKVTIQPAGTTTDRLRSLDGDPGLDGWLVADPWPAIVDEARQSAPLPAMFTTGARPIARSRLVIVAWIDREAILAPTCPGDKLGWKCLGDAAGRPLKDTTGQVVATEVKVGHADPGGDGTGLLVLGQATVEWFARADPARTDLSRDDLDDPDFDTWLGRLEGPANRSSDSPLSTMLTLGRAAYDAVGVSEADAARFDTAAKKDQLKRTYPDTMATADVVLAVTPGVRGERLRSLVADRAGGALSRAGWMAPDDPSLPREDGLPSPGFLDALRSKAREVRK